MYAQDACATSGKCAAPHVTARLLGTHPGDTSIWGHQRDQIVRALALERIGGDEGPLALRSGDNFAAVLDDYDEETEQEDYDAATARAGRVYGIVRTMSLAPSILRASMSMYQRVMFAQEGIARYQRELLAVVVSRTNHCHY